MQSGFAAAHGGKAMPYRKSGLPDFEATPGFFEAEPQTELTELFGKAEPFRRVLRQSRSVRMLTAFEAKPLRSSHHL